MSFFGEISKMKKVVNELNYHLSTTKDEKLIEGYKSAIQDYKRSGNEEILRAAEIIKKELEKRGIEVEDLH